MNSSSVLIVVFVLLPATVVLMSAVNPRPDPKEAAPFARWLVTEASWGVLSTLDPGSGSPFGNVMSFDDGGTGVPYFYLSSLDPTRPFAEKDPRSSLTVSEQEIGTCGGQSDDPQSPACAKITLSGELRRVPEGSTELAMATQSLFNRHPKFNGFPKMNKTFDVFKLELQEVFLVNLFAPPRNLTVEDYLRP